MLQEEFNYAVLTDSIRLCVMESIGKQTVALSFEVGGCSNELDGDIQKVTHQRKIHAHTLELAFCLHVHKHTSMFPIVTRRLKGTCSCTNTFSHMHVNK